MAEMLKVIEVLAESDNNFEAQVANNRIVSYRLNAKITFLLVC